MMDAQALVAALGIAAACMAMGLWRGALARHMARMHRVSFVGPLVARRTARPRPPLALAPNEQQVLLETLNSERFADAAPAAVYATLLDEDRYLGSVRTMYRLLALNGGTGERRRQLTHPAYTKPELLATAPNQIWSWDITKLKGPAKWTCFHLYVRDPGHLQPARGGLVDRPARVLRSGPAAHAQTVARHDVEPGMLTLHADRGASMRSKPVAALLADLSVTKSHSRPHISDDNPYSESHFKTMKYQHDFPARFGCLEDARAYCQNFFAWYNTRHRHSGIGYMTPHSVHYGHAQAMRHARTRTLANAFSATPTRFKGRCPQPPALPTAVWINPPTKEIANTQSQQPCTVNL